MLSLLVARSAGAETMAAAESAYRFEERRETREVRDVREDECNAESWEAARERSLFRLHVGQALLIQPVSPGLMAALDVGRHAVGARLSASFMRAESDQGLASYTAELWVDLAQRYELHPILGAGASFLHGGVLGRERNAGAGVLRGALEYELPLRDADARVGVSLLGLVPAIDSERTRPWLQGGVTIGAGF